MKKLALHLKLHRETLQGLTSGEAGKVVAGAATDRLYCVDTYMLHNTCLC